MKTIAPSLLWDPIWSSRLPMPSESNANSDSSTGEEAESYVWQRQFQDGLRALPTLDDDSRIQYCLAFLEKVVEEAEELPSRADRQDRNTAHLDTVLALSHLYGLSGKHKDVAEARRYEEMSVALAFTFGDREGVYRALSNAGTHEYLRGAYNDSGIDVEALGKATIYLQRSLVYADLPHHQMATLEWLGNVWALQSETVPAASAMYDWIFALTPDDISPLIEKYEVMRKWNPDEVDLLAKRKVFGGLLSMVCTCAARWAAGRRKYALKLAAVGLEAAILESNVPVVKLFSDFIARNSTDRSRHG